MDSLHGDVRVDWENSDQDGRGCSEKLKTNIVAANESGHCSHVAAARRADKQSARIITTLTSVSP